MHDGKTRSAVSETNEVKMDLDLGSRNDDVGRDELETKKISLKTGIRLHGLGNSSSGGGSGGEDSSSDEPVLHHISRTSRHRHCLPPKKYRLKESIAGSGHGSRGTSPGVSFSNGEGEGKDEGSPLEELNAEDDDCSGPLHKDNGMHNSFTSGENSDSEMCGYGEGEDSRQDGEDSGKKLFECDVCNMKFSNGANMRRHRMRHTGVKPFECRVCQKRFFRKDHLAEHMATHSKLLPFRCPICNKGFQRQIAMRAHFQNEHVGGSHNIVKACPLCSYKSGSMKSLRVHFYSRHGIDLDNPLPHSPSLQNSSNRASPVSPGLCGSGSGEYSELAHALGFEDRDKSSDSSLIPSHFLVPQIEISANSPCPAHYPFTADSSYYLQDIKHHHVNGDTSSSINISPKSDSSSNVPSSSDLVVVKREVLEEDQSSPEQSTSSVNSVDETKIKVSVEDDAQDVQDAPEDLSSSGTSNTFRSVFFSRKSTNSPPSSSLVKISPLKSLLREDWKKDTSNSSRLLNGTTTTCVTGKSSSSITSNSKTPGNTGHITPSNSQQVSEGEIISSSAGSTTSQSFRRGFPIPTSIHQCIYCKIVFPDITLYFLHKGCHSDSSPWRCNICGESCCNVYDFNSHLLSKSHQ